jgi:hypothetical protein
LQSLDPIVRAALSRLLALNNAHAEALSPLDADGLASLVRQAFHARCAGLDAFVLALDETADYANPNFRWFSERHSRFVYVDRIVVAPAARGGGIARRLYEDLFEHATRAGHGLIGCEVNLDPPNPESDAFHAALGFTEVGRARLPGGAKTVRYLERQL